MGSNDESGVCSRVCEMTGRKARERVVDLAGKTTVAELLWLVGNADMVVANDSGVAHMAGALGVRTVVFFGPSSPERFKPLSERQANVKVFHHKLNCNPCDQHQCIEGPASYCLARITPAEVAEFIRSMMGEGEDLERKDNQPAQEQIASSV